MKIKRHGKIAGYKIPKGIFSPFRSLIIYICISSILAVTVLLLTNGSGTGDAESKVIDITASAIQDAIDNLEGDPGTIYLKAGEFKLEGVVTLHKGVKIIGAGVGSTVIHTYGDNEWFLIPDGANDCRISGITMIHVPYVAGNAIVVGHRNSYSTAAVDDFVIDNMEFYNYGACEASVFIRGDCSGLVCDSYFFGSMATSTGGFGYGVAVYGPNDTYYTDGRYIGSADNVFIERCEFQNCKHAISSDTCGHFVFRYNAITQNQVTHAVDAHGGFTALQKGTTSCEIYNNTITNPKSENGKAICMRGGQSYIYNNYSSGYNTEISYMLEYGNTSKALIYRVHDSYEWNNTYDSTIKYRTRVSSLNKSRSYIFEGSHYYGDTKPEGYKAYTYPHPLTPKKGIIPNNSY